MSKSLSAVLSENEIDKIRDAALEAADAGKGDEVWEILQPLLSVQQHQIDAAISLLRIVDTGCLTIDHALDALEAVHSAHAQDSTVLGLIGEVLSVACDINQLNAAPPEHPLFSKVIEGLAIALEKTDSPDIARTLHAGLATAARMMGRQYDFAAEASAKFLVDTDSENSSRHYNYGLWCKTRGRFRDGMLANQKAASMVSEPQEAYEWNLGICATGAREGAIALEVWLRMKNKIKMGRFGLPEGGYPQCKVRLAQRPLAERTAETDDPGLEETIWLERLSPCHGIIRSVLYQNLGLDYGDVVLMDGAPITYHTYGEKQIPVFPHLATLVRQSYRFYDFAATQDQAGRISEISEDLERDAIVYSHTENYVVLCATCWRDPDTNHERHEKEEKHIVKGRIAAPPDYSPTELLAHIDRAIRKREPCKIYCPSLCEAAGMSERAAMEKRRFEMIRGSDE